MNDGDCAYSYDQLATDDERKAVYRDECSWAKWKGNAKPPGCPHPKACGEENACLHLTPAKED